MWLLSVEPAEGVAGPFPAKATPFIFPPAAGGGSSLETFEVLFLQAETLRGPVCSSRVRVQPRSPGNRLGHGDSAFPASPQPGTAGETGVHCSPPLPSPRLAGGSVCEQADDQASSQASGFSRKCQNSKSFTPMNTLSREKQTVLIQGDLKFESGRKLRGVSL